MRVEKGGDPHHVPGVVASFMPNDNMYLNVFSNICSHFLETVSTPLALLDEGLVRRAASFVPYGPHIAGSRNSRRRL